MLDPESAMALQEKAARIAESLSLGISFHRDSNAVLATAAAVTANDHG
jgi:hypothetical protein